MPTQLITWSTAATKHCLQPQACHVSSQLAMAHESHEKGRIMRNSSSCQIDALMILKEIKYVSGWELLVAFKLIAGVARAGCGDEVENIV